jgi:UDP-glucuronate 4-epimerase
MNILITGAAGFIGFHLALSLKKNHKIIGLDNFNCYYNPQLKKDRAQLLTTNGISILEEDIRNKESLKSIIKKEGIDVLIHLAAQAGVRHSLTHPEDFVSSNLDGFVSIMEVLKTFPKIKFLFASSSSVYGANKKTPFSLEDKTDMPLNLYGATKKANELIAYAYHHLYNIASIGLRFFTAYGPWGRPDMAYFLFADKIKQEKPIDVFNEGKLMRDFTYIDDVINGIEKALHHKTAYEIFNIGSNHPYSVMDLIRCIEKGLDKKAIINFKQTPLTEVPITYADIEKSKSVLGYSPTTTLQEGMEKFLNWFKKNGDKYESTKF